IAEVIHQTGTYLWWLGHSSSLAYLTLGLFVVRPSERKLYLTRGPSLSPGSSQRKA
ncbi:hypothetical protein PISMIDRAFT_687796, partial [Pisolithus microcarpus 441]